MKTPYDILKENGIVRRGDTDIDVINSPNYYALVNSMEQYVIINMEKMRIQYDAELEAFKISFTNRTMTRVDALEEWLTEYRDQLKKENAFHKNTGIINAINELLDVDQ